MDLRSQPGNKQRTPRNAPRGRGSRDTLCGHWRPEVPLPLEVETSYLILIFFVGLRLIKYSQGSWIKFVQVISSYNSNAESVFPNLIVN